MDEEVALEFAADVASAVASVQDLTESATALADEAKAAADGCATLTESATGTATAVKDAADSTEAAAVSLTAYSDEAKSAASAAGDLALAQANLKVASADVKAAVADLAAVQATAGKDSTEYAAQLDAVAAAMGRQATAASALKDVEAQQAAATVAASDSAAAAATTAGTAQEGAAAKADAAAAGGLAKYKMALVGIGVGAAVAVDGAVKYQAETTRLVTSAGESASNLDKVRQGMLAISSATDQSTEQLSSGMYLVESAGFHGANGLTVLTAAAQGAKDEGAELSTVANGVTDALVDFHRPASDAATVTSQLIAGVSHGKTTFEEFSGSMSTILPLASSLHLSLADVTGVLAEMTAHGMSARQAADDEANAMRELMKPNAAMTKEWGLMGISAQQVNKELSTAGLGGTLQWMSGVAQDGAQKIGQNYNQALGKMVGTAAALQVALMTTGENAQGTNAAIRDISTASADAQGNVEGFATVSQTAAFKLGAAGQATKAMGISLGEALVPAVMAVIGPITSFLQLIASNQAASYAFAIVVGGILAGAIGLKLAGALKDAKEGITAAGEGIEWLAGKLGLATAATEAETVATEAATVAQGELDVAMDANPIGLVILAVAALIAIVVLLVTHWKTVWHVITSVVDDAVSFIRSHWALVLDILLGPVGLAVTMLVQHWNTIKADVTAVINWIKDNWKAIVAWLVDPVGMAVHEITTHTQQIAQGFDTARHDTAAVIDGIGHDVKAGFDTVTHDIAAFADWLPTEIEHGFESAHQDAVKAAEALVKDVESSFDTLRHDASAGVDDVVSFFEKLPGEALHELEALPGQMLTAGENVVNGLLHGVENAATGLLNEVTSLAGDVEKAFTDPLAILSPSRVMYQHGWNTVQGALDGVKANAPNLVAAMRGLGTGVAAQGIGAAGAVAPASGSTSVHVSVPMTVQGSAGAAYTDPAFQQYLQQQVQEATLRYAQLNPGNGLTPAWGR